MSASLRDRFEVLRDESLNLSEYGNDAPGTEVFEAVCYGLSHLGDTEPNINLSLHDALSRRLAWGEDPSTVIVDCDDVSRRILNAVQRSFPDTEESTIIVGLVTSVACAASRHLARIAVQRASKERALNRREIMVQKQLSVVLAQQDDRFPDS